MIRAAVFLFLALAASAARAAPEEYAAAVARTKARWVGSPYGPMLERILPPGFEPSMLPQPESRGAGLAVRYCVQCHNLPNPAMHHAEQWPRIVGRMVLRMRGQGNLGRLMTEMMAGVAAPSDEEAEALLRYLKRHAQRPLDPGEYPDVATAAGEAFRLACQQCHVLPDPKRYTAREWPAVVARMQRNMEWMNHVVGSRPVKGEPQLRIPDINAWLMKHARASR
jgi:hypothetical protein